LDPVHLSGITGYVLGGGGGDLSLFAGYGADIVKAFDYVLYNGTIGTASEDENEDLFWALRGGGGGDGVITHLAYKVVQVSEPKNPNEDRKYPWINLTPPPEEG